MNRIEREKQTVQRMIELYCHHHLKVGTMPEEYQHLAEFACRRLDHCKYGENKTACKNCPTHCYASKEREQIREIMRWAGPRMILYSPKDAIVHTFYNVKHWLQSLSFRTGVIVLLCCIPSIYCPSPRCYYLSALRQKASFGRCSSDWQRPVSMEV